MDQNCLIRTYDILEQVFKDTKADISSWARLVYGKHTLHNLTCGVITKIGRKKANIPCVMVSSDGPITPELRGENPSEQLKELYQYFDQVYQKYGKYFAYRDTGMYIFVNTDLGEYITLKNGKSFVRGIHKIFGCYTYFACKWNVKGQKITVEAQNDTDKLQKSRKLIR